MYAPPPLSDELDITILADMTQFKSPKDLQEIQQQQNK